MVHINLRDLTFNIPHITQLKPSVKSQIFQTLNSFGFLLIEGNEPKQSNELFLSLSLLFGNILKQDQSNNQGVFPIMVMSNYPEYVNTKNNDLALHTDGSFEQITPKIMAMYCEVAAKQGGETQLVDGKVVYEYLAQTNPEGLMTLFEPDIFTIKRANRSATRSIFTEHNGRINIAFRADDNARISVNQRAIESFNLIKNFVADSANQMVFKLKPNQILVFDNTRMLHGRTGFEINDTRKLNGLWFDGSCPEAFDLKVGFVPMNQHFLQTSLRTNG